MVDGWGTGGSGSVMVSDFLHEAASTNAKIAMREIFFIVRYWNLTCKFCNSLTNEKVLWIVRSNAYLTQDRSLRTLMPPDILETFLNPYLPKI